MSDPVARAEMQIRRPPADVFEAFADPAITSRFWFTSGSGRLEPGARVKWEWAMYGFSVDVEVRAADPDRIAVVWSAYGAPSTIEWRFAPLPDGTTFVSVTNRGFAGGEAEKMKAALDATEGFAFVLAGAKAWLEHGVELNLVRDRFPQGLDGAGAR
ncbi:MAG TPA: SRPBCC family protein [Allosphingosinicella sp.]|nr:SRPBCC family protein [Allosphingosinicella sp.]